MKAIINSSKNSNFEFIKRFIYSFQVLMVGIAIPVLFIIGVATNTAKKSNEKIVNEVSTSNQTDPVKTTIFIMPRI